MIKSFVINITTEERDEILNVFEEANSLKALLKILVEPNLMKKNENLYEKAKKELSIIKNKNKSWWDKLYKKYNINCSNKNLIVNFKDCAIYSLD